MEDISRQESIVSKTAKKPSGLQLRDHELNESLQPQKTYRILSCGLVKHDGQTRDTIETIVHQ